MGCTASNTAAVDGVGSKSSLVGLTPSGKPTASFFEKYALGKKLGKGAFAQVRVGTSTQSADTEPVAVKIMDLRADPDGPVSGPLSNLRQVKLDSENKQDAIQEAGVWRKAGKHPQIVGLQEAFLECGCSFFVMELCDCSLLRFLENGANQVELNERSLAFVLKQNLLACKHIHGLGIVHRDIKPDNFMVKGQVVKMCDFGLAGVLGEKEGALFSGVCGTAPYMAPEIVKGLKYGAAVDNWALGVMTYTLLFGAFPYNGKERTAKDMKKAIRDGTGKPTYSPVCAGAPQVSEFAVAFCTGLLNRSPAKRLALDDALSSDFLRDCEHPDASLPSLRLVLTSCKRAGVFDKKRLELPEKLDKLLERLHKELLGKPMGTEMPKKNDEEAPSGASSGRTSLASNQWKQSHSTLGSRSTCASSVYSGVTSGVNSGAVPRNSGAQH